MPTSKEELTLHPSAHGYLDGFLGLDVQSNDDDYLAGYERGVGSAARGGE